MRLVTCLLPSQLRGILLKGYLLFFKHPII
uniref:Uncharacterized protein n=1 Tax=Podoviridae sp. ct8Lf7 TaxID=2827723 RepID=A0A8S5S044_9CAUD|nr:MAG TPA: hypothetical protein [Podoviridae sp. ct8Lf7]